MSKILFLNPPCNKKTQRDYYCSHTLKGDYLWQPIDLYYLSGTLKNHNTKLLDCIFDNIDNIKCIKKIKKFNPDYIISQIGSATLKNDISILEKIHTELNIPIILSGDIVRSLNKDFFKYHSFCTAIITNFIYSSIEEYINEDLKWNPKFYNLATKYGYNEKKLKDNFEISLPNISILKNKKYTLPYTEKTPIYSTIASFGCPFSCKYCHFENIYYKKRSIKNLYLELLKAKKNGYKYIHFRDQTFGFDKKHLSKTIKILKKIELPYSIYSRVDVLEIKDLTKLKKTGLHTIEIGVESGSYSIRKLYNKNIKNDLYINFFKYCKRLNINTLAIFIIGFKEDTNNTIELTKRFIKKLFPDFLSVNLLIPKHGTSVEENESFNIDLDPSSGALKSIRLKKIQSKIMFRFYFSPKYIFRKLKKINNISEFYNLTKGAIGFVKNSLM